LLHGTPLGPEIWQGLRCCLTGQPVRTPDCSRVPGGEAAASIAAQVASHLGTGPVDVVGHSFGGQIALDLALLRPQQVRSLTLICSRDAPFPAFADTAAAIRGGALPAPNDTLSRWFTPAELQAEGPAVQEARQELGNASHASWANALDAIARYDRRDRVPELTMPVTLIAAGRDAVSTPAVMANLARRLPRSRLEVRDAWMHMSPFVYPDEVAAMLDAAGDRFG